MKSSTSSEKSEANRAGGMVADKSSWRRAYSFSGKLASISAKTSGDGENFLVDSCSVVLWNGEEFALL